METTFKEAKAMARKGNVVPVGVDLPADLLTPVLAFLRLSKNRKRAFLLESVEGGERLARYSFVGIDPFEILSVEKGKTTLERGKRKQTLPGNPFEAIVQHLSRYRAAHSLDLPPFQGGAVGFLGYEFSQYTERALAFSSSLPSASRYDAYLMLFKNIIAFDHLRSRVVVVSNIFTDQESLKSGYRRAIREARSICRQLLQQTRLEKAAPFKEAPISESALANPSFSKNQFFDSVDEIKNHIRKGNIFQCVLSDRFEFRLKAEPLAVYRALRMLNPSPYLFYLNLGDEILLGASPEMLVKVNDRVIETHPIAGTRPRGKNEAEDKKLERNLLASVKERAEHVMLVDLARNDVGRVSEPGTVRVHDLMHVEKFSHVMHLVTRVEGTLKKGKTAWDALAACFPAGTLTGAPKIRAMQIISSLEPVRRGHYGGAVVYSDFSGRLDSCITIRSLLIRGKTAYAQAGAGVVADSRAQSEYQEILNKSKAVLRAAATAEAS